jgi:hypothetical protein
MAATASEVLRRQLESFTKGVAEIPADRPALQAVLEILRDITSSPANAVIYELTVAARTDEKLRETLQHELGQYAAKIDDVARALPGVELFPEETFLVLVALMRNVFDGAAVIEGVLPQPEIAAQRIPVLMALLTAALPDAES